MTDVTDTSSVVKWINYIYWIDFDLDMGPTVSFVIPKPGPFSNQKIKEIACTSFPDCNTHVNKCLMYPIIIYENNSTQSYKWYGIVYYRQNNNKCFDREVKQQSLLILTCTPHIDHILELILNIIAVELLK